MTTKHPSFALVIACVISGCAVGPEYVAPQINSKQQFVGQQEVTQRSAAVQTALETWWQGYQDPLLTRLIQLALQQNLEITQAQSRIEQAKAGLSAANVALLPSGKIDGYGARAYQSTETPIGQLLTPQPGYSRYSNSYEANLGIGWELDLFGSLRQGQAAALADYQAAEASKVAIQLVVAAQTADIYIHARGLQLRLDVANRQLQTQQALVSNLRLLFEHGLIAKSELDQAESLLAQARVAVPVLEASLQQMMNALDVMLGALPGTYQQELASVRSLPAIPSLQVIGMPADLLRRRPDLIVAERKLVSANAQLGQAISEYYPKFSLSGLIGSATATSSELFNNASSQATAVLGLRWRLFDFGRINAQIDHAKGREAELLAAYRLANLRATEEVENSFTELLKMEQQVFFLQQGTQSLDQARSAAQAAYTQGVVSQIEVLQADERFLRMTDAHLQAQIAAVRASIKVFKALGGGWNSHAEQQS